MSEIGNELKREMDTFINITIKVKPSKDTRSIVSEDLNQAIPKIPEVARKLSAFRRLKDIISKRDAVVDYVDSRPYGCDCGTLITMTFIGSMQPSEMDRDRLNSMIPGIIQSDLMATGHYDEVSVTL